MLISCKPANNKCYYRRCRQLRIQDKIERFGKKKLTKILDGKSNPKNDLALNEKLKV